jgi:hypothetical protein
MAVGKVIDVEQVTASILREPGHRLVLQFGQIRVLVDPVEEWLAEEQRRGGFAGPHGLQQAAERLVVSLPEIAGHLSERITLAIGERPPEVGDFDGVSREAKNPVLGQKADERPSASASTPTAAAGCCSTSVTL